MKDKHTLKESVIYDTINYLKKNDSKWDELINFIKFVDKSNPYDYEDERDSFRMWSEQANINFPILYLASIYLYVFAKRNECYKILFATRDCCHWYKIFKKLFPQMDVHYFNCSRNMFTGATQKTNKYYNSYVESIIGNDIEQTIYVDIHGSGKTMFDYFETEFKETPYCFLLSARFPNYSAFPYAIDNYLKHGKIFNLVFNAKGSPIEMLNYDNIGTLQTFSSLGPLRDPPEYDLELVKPYHDCIHFAIDNLDNHELSNKQYSFKYESELTKLEKLIDKLYKCIKITRPTIAKYIKHIGKHKKNKKIERVYRHRMHDFDKNKTYIVESNKKNYNKLQYDKPHYDKPHYDKQIFEKKNEDDNNDVFKRANFHKILSNNTTYGIIWDGLFDDKPCVIKMVLLSSGAIYNKHNSKYFEHNDETPFKHKEFKKRKPMTIDAFLHEAKELKNLSHLGIAPKFYKYWICNDRYNMHYGFIAMKKMDCSLKDILLERSLKKEEQYLVKKMIDKMHNEYGIIHGDMKPSNIGVILDKNYRVKDCVVFDCQKVKHHDKCDSDEFHRLIEKDWNVYKRHTIENRSKGKQKDYH